MTVAATGIAIGWMSLLAVSLVLASAFLHALTSLLTKGSQDKQVFFWCYSFLGLILYFPVFLYFLMRHGAAWDAVLLWCGLSGLIHFFYGMFLTRAYEGGDLSLVYPIMRSSPALVLLCAVVFLREDLSLQGVAGILLVAFGVYIINLKHLHGSDLMRPLRNLFKSPPVQFAFLTMLSVTGYSLVDKVGVQRMHPMIYSWFMLAFTVAFYTPYVCASKKLSAFKAEWAGRGKQIVLNAIISKGGYLLILIAFTFETVSYVAGFRQLSIVFAVLMGSHILKERHRGVRLLAALIIFSGAFLIAATP